MTFQQDMNLLDTMIDDIFDPVSLPAIDEGVTSEESKAATWAVFEKYRDRLDLSIGRKLGSDFRIEDGGEVKSYKDQLGELSALVKETIFNSGESDKVRRSYADRARLIIQTLRDQT